MQHAMDTSKINIDTGTEKINISYIEAPSSIPTRNNILFLHGFLGNVHLYKPITDQIRQFSNMTAIDIPGFGNSGDSQKYDIEYTALIIENFIKKKNIPNPILFGHSMGGILSYTIASRAQIDIDKVITQGTPINTQSISNSALAKIHIVQKFFNQKKFVDLTKVTESIFSSPKSIDFITKAISKYNGYKQLINQTPEEIIRFSIETLRPQAIVKIADIFDPLDLTNHVKNIKVPTLALIGKRDKTVKYKEVQKINKINPRIKVKVINDFVHQQVILNPKSVAEEAYEFINDNPKP